MKGVPGTAKRKICKGWSRHDMSVSVEIAGHKVKRCARCNTLSNRYAPPEACFWSKVDKGGPKGCWLWTGAIQRQGYGQFIYKGQNWRAHKLAWFLTYGSVPDGMAEMKTVLMHLCDVKTCVNPKHVVPASQRENLIDMFQKGRKAGVLTPEQVREIRRLSSDGLNLDAVSQKTGINRHAVYLVVSGRTFSEVV